MLPDNFLKEKKRSYSKLNIICLFDMDIFCHGCLREIKHSFKLHFLDCDDIFVFKNKTIPYDFVLCDTKHFSTIANYNKKQLYGNINIPLFLLISQSENIPVYQLTHPLVNKTIIIENEEKHILDKINSVIKNIPNRTENKANNIPILDNDYFLTKINKSIQKNLETNRITVDDIAKEVLISPSNLRIKIKKTTGMTAVQYILFFRIKIAKDLIENKGLKVNESATKTGFMSLSYFSKSFKKVHGVSPSVITNIHNNPHL